MNRNPAVKICIISGEDSGDFHGARLARAIRELLPDVQLDGVGGAQMAAAGVSLIFPSSRLAVVGITEVIARLPAVYEGWRAIKTYLAQERPNLVVLIDFPDFNLQLIAPQVKKLHLPLVYYISPQVWAWRRGRVKKIQSLVDRMLVILPFEEEFYRRYGVEVTYVGHPLVDEFAHFQLLPRRQRPFIALLPGSRTTEVRRLLPEMLEAARVIRRTHSGQQFILPLAPSMDKKLVAALLPPDADTWLTLVREPLSTCLQHVFFAVVTSGTATLETALAGVPMVVVYRVGRLSYEIGKRLISVPHISLVNLVAGNEVVPELIQSEVLGQTIAGTALAIIDDPERYEQMAMALASVRQKLGAAGGSRKAATEVIRCLPSGAH